MKLKSEVKEKWLAALRSGEYTQGRGQLRTARRHYCCIGVLCDISNLGEWVDGRESDEGYSYVVQNPHGITPDRAWATAPVLVRDWALEGTAVGFNDEWEVLVKMNDYDRMDFPEIADWIESNL